MNKVDNSSVMLILRTLRLSETLNQNIYDLLVKHIEDITKSAPTEEQFFQNLVASMKQGTEISGISAKETLLLWKEVIIKGNPCILTIKANPNPNGTRSL